MTKAPRGLDGGRRSSEDAPLYPDIVNPSERTPLIVIKNREKSNPRLSTKGQDRFEDRLSRQAEALRANLQKRKQQMRARAETDKKADEDTSGSGRED